MAIFSKISTFSLLFLSIPTLVLAQAGDYSGSTAKVTYPATDTASYSGTFTWDAAGDSDNQSYVTITLYRRFADGTLDSRGSANEVTFTKNISARTGTFSMGSLGVTSGLNYTYRAVLYNSTGTALKTVDTQFTAP